LDIRLLDFNGECAMGTVGLSFGSPTSGTGFDVSSTVASIVSNLENVETPWKTQLTSLQSQDTVISSLGTLFSKLSNDLSSLTDLTGIMAQKTGGSSDTNVLELTAADATAAAGTYTVQVANLAQTSSGYFASVPSDSTALSGSITLQAGTGASQTFTLNSGDTLSDLESDINNSTVGITANILTDSSGSRLSLTSQTSGASGDLTVTDNSITAATANTLSYSGTAGASNTTSSGTLAPVAATSDTLSGSISIQVGSGQAQTVALPTGGGTLSDLVSAIKSTTGIGVTASVVTNSDGTSSLSLLSDTSGTDGTLTVTSSISDTSTALGYTSTLSGKEANLTVNGVSVTSDSNTVTGLIKGVSFDLLAPSSTESDGSLETVQVVIGNDNTDIASTVNTFVSDYNSLVSAMNAQEGNDSSGNAEPLFGSPTLSLLQQQLLGGLNLQNPNGNLDQIATNTDTTLSGSITVAVGSGTTQNFIIGAAPSTIPADTFYTGAGNNTLQNLADTINAAAAGTTMTYTGTAGTDSLASSGALTAIPDANLALSGSISVQVGNGTAENFVIGSQPSTGAAANTTYLGDDTVTLATLASAISHASLGVTASVSTPSGGQSTLTFTSGTTGTAGTLNITSSLNAAGTGISANVDTNNNQSSLSLLSQTTGSSGALAVKSSVSTTSDTLLSYTGHAGTSTTASYGSLTTIANSGDALSGSISIQVGSGTATTVNVDPANATLSGLVTAINNAKLGVTAVADSNGTTLSFLSGTQGTAGTLTINSSILDTTDTTTASLGYSNSSDVSDLANLGITPSTNYDGTISFDETVLTSALNSDFSGVLGFFQNLNSWGQSFTTLLNDAGTSSSTGTLALAETANSNSESTLNANVSKEESLISLQQKSLTAELNSANEIMQELPSQLNGINELYSAITGYNSSTNG
jgi:flagellar hook-associated protein 2